MQPSKPRANTRLNTKGPEYHTIITLKNSFHGRTITTLAATGQDVFHHDFLPLTEGFAYAEANDLDDLKAQVAAHKCAAIMIEVVQGEGGVIPLTQEFVKGAAQLAAAQDILLICDEVQTGQRPHRQALRLYALRRQARHRLHSQGARRRAARWAQRCSARRCRTCSPPAATARPSAATRSAVPVR